MDLAEIMATTFAVVSPTATLADASRRMIDVDTGAAAVVEGESLVGMISERDLLRVFRDGGSPDELVEERMTRDVLAASPSTAVPEAMAIMVDGKFRHLPVVKDGRVVGMISMRDLMAWASLTIRSGGHSELDEVDTAELLATINRMRTGAGAVARAGAKGALTAPRVLRLTRANGPHRGLRATAAAASAGIVGLSLGLMGWSVEAIVVIVGVSVLVAWLVGSLSRAIIVIGAAGGCATAVAFVGSELAAMSGNAALFSWHVVVWAWVGIALLIAAGWWWRGVDEEVTLVEVIASICALLIAAALHHHVDFTASLYGVLVGHEDNAAWVLLNRTVELSGMRVDGVDTPLGPAIGTLLGVLQSTRAAGVPAVNAVVAAYGSALLLTPVVTAAFFRHRLEGRRAATLAFFGVTFMWAFSVPSRLTVDFGHLATIYAFLSLLLLLALIVTESPSILALVNAAGLSLLVGAFWFPLTPLAVACLVMAAIRYGRGGTNASRVSAVLAVGMVTSLLLWRLGIALQIGDAGQPGVRGTTDQLLAATGATASADAVLTLGALAGLVALALIFDRLDDVSKRLVLLAGLVTLFVVVLLSGVSLMRAEITSYAVTKYVFLSVMVLVVLVFAAVSRYRMPLLPTGIVLIVLVFYGFNFGGGAALLSRHGLGDGPEPAWTLALRNAVAAQDAEGDRRPIICVSADPTEAYTCTRWAEALTAQYVDLGYRLGVINGTPTDTALSQLKASGGLAGTDIVVLSAPAGDQGTLARLYRDAHAILGPDGTEVGHVVGS